MLVKTLENRMSIAEYHRVTIVRRTLACSPSTCSDNPAAISRTEVREKGGRKDISFPTEAAPTKVCASFL